MKNNSSRKGFCCECKEPIEMGAKKCIHCNSYQNWRRYMPLSSDVLALLIALLSILTVGAPIVADAFSNVETEISISATGVRLGCIGSGSISTPALVIEAFVTNHGKMPGILKSAYIRNKNTKAEHDLIYREKKQNSVGAVPTSSFVAPGDWQIASLYITAEDLIKTFSGIKGDISPDNIPFMDIDVVAKIIDYKGIESNQDASFKLSKNDLKVDHCIKKSLTKP